MRVEFHGLQYRLQFRHEKLDVPKEITRDFLLVGRYTHVTHCHVQRIDVAPERGWRTLGTGYARCSEADVFCKETGRRVALGRALKRVSVFETNSPRELRGALLCAYFTRKRQGNRQ